MRGYQWGFFNEAFLQSIFVNRHPSSIESAYLDGVSITHGISPRQHIWSFAAGVNPARTKSSEYVMCPCNSGRSATPPAYVGNNYYCESGVNTLKFKDIVLYSNDPLWDGQQCPGNEASCCTKPNMPWFNTTLPQHTSDYIELRLCANQASAGTPLELIEIYIR